MTADLINNNNDNNNSVAAATDNSVAITAITSSSETEETAEKTGKDPEPQVLPPTIMLYYTNEGNRLTTCRSRVLSIQEKVSDDVITIVGSHSSNSHTKNDVKDTDDVTSIVVDVCLDQTILHAQGGGQPTDFGRLQLLLVPPGNDENDDDALEAAAGEVNADESAVTVHVDKVLLDRTTGVATHTGRLVVANPARKMMMLCVGDVVQVTVDEERRQILSECHTAGHGTYVCCCFNYTIVVGSSNTMNWRRRELLYTALILFQSNCLALALCLTLYFLSIRRISHITMVHYDQNSRGCCHGPVRQNTQAEQGISLFGRSVRGISRQYCSHGKGCMAPRLARCLLSIGESRH
jgi:hypothetical protein